MENAAEALKIAFAVLMFVAALSLSISSFSSAKTAIDNIITMRDKTQKYMYVTPAKSSNRIVGVETVIPTMYKAYQENFRIVFMQKDGEELKELPIYYYTDIHNSKVYDSEKGEYRTINYIDLENERLAGKTEAIQHLDILLEARKGNNKNDNKYYEQFMEDKISGLYEYLKDKKFEEVLGEYYQEDLEAAQKGTVSDALDINKTKKRVVTYILQ